MSQVAVKTLQDDLGHYVDRARQGETIVLTEDERPIAVLSGVDEQEIRQGWELVNAGIASWSGGKPQPPADPPKIKGTPTSEIVIENRR